MIPKIVVSVLLAGGLSLAAIFTYCAAFMGTEGGNAHPQAHLAREAFAVLTQYCVACHGEQGAHKDRMFVNRAAMVKDQHVVPGSPDASAVYLRIANGTMPPGGSRLQDAEVAVIRRWIAAGAPDWAQTTAPSRPPQSVRSFISIREMLSAMRQDLQSQGARDRRFVRYLVLTHLYNAGASEQELRTDRIAVSRLVNGLSWKRRIVMPQPVDPEQTILRIDLRDYGWDESTRERILQVYPYGVEYIGNVAAQLSQSAGGDLPFVRGDWFVAQASVPPLYYEMLQLPRTASELETLLGVDAAKSVEQERDVVFAGLSNSGVSNHNRAFARYESLYGGYWRTFDFASSQGNQNIFQHPLDFAPDGGEIIFHLPNGLFGFMLVNGNGERLDAAPVNIVFNKASSTEAIIRAGRPCLSCHAQGFNPIQDQVRP